jgi:protein O-mannosyl-transferase
MRWEAWPSAGYHAFNLAIHLLAGLTLYGIVRRTLLRPGLSERFGASAEWIALAVALLWTVHPLQTEAVTYISQRSRESFYLGCLVYLRRDACIESVFAARNSGKRQRSPASRRDPAGLRLRCPFEDSAIARMWFVLSVAACFLGMASKEVMVTAPVMVLLYDRTFVSGSFREAWHQHWRLYLGLAGSWLLLGCLMVGLHNRNVGYGLGMTWWGYALTECRAVVQYLAWPSGRIR